MTKTIRTKWSTIIYKPENKRLINTNSTNGRYIESITGSIHPFSHPLSFVSMFIVFEKI